jgi:hypothetical protein
MFPLARMLFEPLLYNIVFAVPGIDCVTTV